MLIESGDDFDVVAAVNRLDIHSRLTIGNAAAQFCAVIDTNFKRDEDRTSSSAIAFAYRLFLAQRDH